MMPLVTLLLLFGAVLPADVLAHMSPQETGQTVVQATQVSAGARCSYEVQWLDEFGRLRKTFSAIDGVTRTDSVEYDAWAAESCSRKKPLGLFRGRTRRRALSANIRETPLPGSLV